MPLAIVVWVLLHRAPAFEGKEVREWFREMQTGQASPALTAFQKMGSAAVPPLQQALRTGVYSEQVKAAWALGQLGPVASNAIPELLHCLDGDLPSIKVFAIQSLETIAPAQVDAVQKLVTMLADTNPGVSNCAADLLNKVERERKAIRGSVKNGA